MVISICGNNKTLLIDRIKEIYSDRVIVCDYFTIKLNSIIDTEKYKYQLLDSLSLESARLEYSKIVDREVRKRMDRVIKENNNKIIIIINDAILNKDYYSTEYFLMSDLKILISDDIDDKYNYELFEYVYNNVFDINIKKLVKL